MIQVWRSRKLSNFQDSPPPPCPCTSKILPPPWPWTSNSKLILQSTCFICKSWKCKLWNSNCTVHVSERNQNKQNQITSRSNWPRVLLFDLAHKQCNGIIKRWFHCLTSESKGRFLVNNILFGSTWCLVQFQNTP